MGLRNAGLVRAGFRRGGTTGTAGPNVEYWVAAADPSVPNAKDLSGITGLVKSTAGTPSAAVAGTDYVYPAGVAGGQTIVGGVAASENLTLQSTAHATRGKVLSVDDVWAQKSGGTIGFWADQGSVAAQLIVDGTAAYVGTTSAHTLNFRTGGTTRFSVDASGNVVATGANYQLVNSGSPQFSVDGGVDAVMTLRVASGAAGDPKLLLSVFGVLTWGIGADNDNNDTLKIGTSSTIGTNTAVSISTGLTTTTHGRFNQSKGVDVASAGTLTLGSDGNTFDITGGTTVNYITTTGWTAGAIIVLRFEGALTVTHDAATPPANTAPILLNGSVDLITAAETMLVLAYDGTDWQELARKAA